ncbi:MAG: hypothetical protein NTW10_00965 [Bacteroidetes bacterium]|nr:hypothetical protein [Bacteroidota bacterium]
MAQIDLTGVAPLQNVVSGTTITLRYYASGQTTTGGWGFQSAATAGTNGLAIGGSVVASGNSITTGVVSTPPFCVDASNTATGTVAYTSTGTYTSATFTAYLSDAGGTFGGSPPSIGTATVSGTNPSGSINITIPAGTASGIGYKIRIDCSSPAVTGSPSSAFEIINGAKDVSAQSAGVGNASSVLSWTNPSGCFDEIMIVAKAGSPVTVTPTGNGSLYTYNLVFGTGGSGANLPTNEYCVYKGTASPQTVTGLTNGTNYNYKFFSRKGSNWSAGVTANATPVPPSSSTDYFKSNVATGNWSVPGSWLSSPDNSTWITATLAPGSSAKKVTVQTGHTISVDASVTAAPIVIDAGGQITVNSTFILTIQNGIGTDLAIDGTIVNNGSVTLQGATATTVTGTFTNAGTLTMNTASTSLSISGIFNANTGVAIANALAGPISFTGTAQYNHTINGGTIPTSTWGASTTCNVTGMTSSQPSGLGQTFGNFTWNCAQTGTNYCNVNDPFFSTTGILTISNTGSSAGFSLSYNNTFGSSYTYNFGSINVTGGLFQLLFRSGTSNAYATYVNVSGDVSVSGTAEIQFGSSGGSVINGNNYCSVMNIGGNLTVGNSSKFYCKSTTNYGLVIFSGTSSIYTNVNSVANNTTNNYGLDYAVSPSTTLTLNSNLSLWSSSSTAYDFLNIAGTLSTGAGNLVNPSTGVNADFEVGGNTSGALTFTRTNGSQTLTAGDYSTLFVGMGVSGTGIAANTYIIDFIGTTDVLLSKPATASGTSSLTFTSSGKIITGNSNGLLSSGASGAIQVGTRTYNSTANYEFRGAATGTFTTTPTANTVNNLTINNAAGVSLGQNITVNGTLELTSGILTTGSNIVTVASAASISGAGSSNYVSGLLARVFSGTGSKTFPIGKGGNYRPLSINYAAVTNTSTVTAEQFESSLPGSAPANTTVYNSRYWTITQSGGTGLSYYVTLDGTGFSPTYAAVMVKGDGSTNSAYAASFSSPNYTNSGPFDSFSNFGLGETNEFVWTGTSSTTWSDAGNWNVRIAPVGINNVTIPSGPTNQPVVTSSPATPSICNNLDITSGAVVTINPGCALTVTGTTTMNATECLVLKSDATGTASFIDNGISGGGTARMERYLTPDKWHYISSPISNATANIFFGDYLMTSDPSTASGWSGWIVDPSSPLTVMRRYACWKPSANAGLETFSGTLNTGSQTITLSRNGSDPWAGWHLVGNPYPSAIDLSSVGITWDQFEPTAYFWHESLTPYPPNSFGNYDVYPAYGSWGTHFQFAPPEQGFYVHINGAYVGSSTLTIPNTARVHDNTQIFLKDAPVIRNGLLILVQNVANAFSDRITVHFNPNATAGYDPGYDAYKLWGSGTAPQLYTRIGDTNVTCNSLPFVNKNMVVPMGFSCGLPGTYTLIADSLGTFDDAIAVSLEDLKLNMTQDLRTNPVYNFQYDTADSPNRFLLHFDNPTLGVKDPVTAIEPVQIYSFGNAIYVSSKDGILRAGSVFVYDMIGKELFRGTLSNQLLNRFTPEVAEGYYLVRVVTLEGSFNGKVYLK